MKSKRIGIVSAGALIVGALALMVLRWPLASEAVYPVERFVRLLTRPGRTHDETQALSLLRGDLERLQAENARLRKELGYRERQPEAWIAAEVLASAGGASAVRHAIRVDRGRLDGVKAGAVVVVPDGLVGRVTDVSPHTAEVALLTDPSVKVACEIEAGAGGRARGILCGGEPDGLQIRYLEHADRAGPHARVMTSGLGGVFPRGLGIGTLHLVTNDVRGVEGEVLPSVDYLTLEDVFIRRGQ